MFLPESYYFSHKFWIWWNNQTEKSKEPFNIFSFIVDLKITMALTSKIFFFYDIIAIMQKQKSSLGDTVHCRLYMYLNPDNQPFIYTFTLASFHVRQEKRKFACQTHKVINKQETLQTFNSVETKKYSRMPWNICCTKP